jgi:hypothetical protein
MGPLFPVTTISNLVLRHRDGSGPIRPPNSAYGNMALRFAAPGRVGSATTTQLCVWQYGVEPYQLAVASRLPSLELQQTINLMGVGLV